ncbi:hypothetical protein SAMN04487891_1186 [Flagellimonas taeanensis]|uniref:Uncharacterized protein n=1 Tax=Flagellimonas taeanensis TaxID=1005926 RepID=A0A1M7CUT2_9FLAO|nr:tail fiber protein [Allomuricauda taeanensis]SFC65922.1 hypothetical protein SAMN04487891_1186 [Allomuricauda taeanensis]SHL71002.1 hypothetical protein SAMN05216293_4124 [Allomuricauda taeanensis]
MKNILYTLVVLFSISTYGQVFEGPNGNVGIGTTSPSNKLEVNGTAGVQDALVIQKGSTYRIALNGTTNAYINGRNSLSENMFTINSNGPSYFNGGNVGIGTTSPSNKLEVNGTAGVQDAIVIQKGSAYRIALNGTNDAYITGRNSSSESMFTINSNGPSYLNGGNVGIGTASPDAKLTVKGRVHAEEVKVDLSVSGPDYVFKDGYDLKSLEEVQNYIKEHGHLPNIPSAKEMEANGIQLGEMNMKLLEKIEELTLYIIHLEKESKKMQDFEARLKKLENKS